MNQATPRPWTMKHTSQNGRVILQGGNQNTTDSFSIGLDEANAKLIVKAVNEYDENQITIRQLQAENTKQLAKIKILKSCHDELIDALKDALQEMEISLGNCEQEEKELITFRINKAKQALSKAQEAI